MALNLNKNEDESKTPSSQKKGLNLSKSDDSKKDGINLSKSEETPKVGLNLTKEKLQSDPKPSTPEAQSEPKKKSPIMLIVIIAVVLLGVFWYINNQNNGSSESPAVTETPTAPTDTLATQPGVSSDTVSNEQPAGAGTPEQEISTNGEPEITNVATQNTNSGVTNTVKSGSEGSVEKKAQDVIDGVYGNGKARKRALGSEYKTIQAKVNEMYRNK